ncbi:MAG: hypothetical protein KTV77_01260 [Wolbachia endosymbiont of Fragariocoptes setiger]|nr:hypothetical protein [Wolbachia endosymbiont of Fragariocoptes setiger]
MQRSLSKPNITKQECTNVINMLKDKIVNNDIKSKLSEENTYGKYTMKVMENKTNHVEICI